MEIQCERDNMMCLWFILLNFASDLNRSYLKNSRRI